jgi:hypothetical protein
MMREKLEKAILELTLEQQKKLFADTLADSIIPLIDTVIRTRCNQWVEVIHRTLQKR